MLHLLTGFIVGIISGVLIAYLVYKIWGLSIFLIGAGVGFVLWIVIQALFPNLLPSEFVLYAVMAGLCLLFGGLAVMAETWWILVGTSVLGTILYDLVRAFFLCG